MAGFGAISDYKAVASVDGAADALKATKDQLVEKKGLTAAQLDESKLTVATQVVAGLRFYFKGADGVEFSVWRKPDVTYEVM
eukprot:UN04018